MMNQNPFRLYEKARRVIESCGKPEHIPMCKKFVYLIVSELEQIGTSFSVYAAIELNIALSNKEDTLVPKSENMRSRTDYINYCVNFGLLNSFGRGIMSQQDFLQYLNAAEVS